MRLFLAIQVSPEVRRALADAADDLRRQGRGSFTRPENLHLTLAFIGETEDLARAKVALERACAGRRPFSMVLEGSGCFGDLWWAGVRENEALAQLAMAVQGSLRDVGFAIEDRAWTPHFTLARRWKGPRPEIRVAPRSMEVRRVTLMRSEQVDGQLTYTEVCGVEL